MRRQWHQVGAALCTAAMLFAVGCGGDDSSDNSGGGSDKGSGSVTYVSWGGYYQEGQTKLWLDPFEKANPGIRVVQDEPTDYAKLKAMVEAGNVTWDVVDVGGDFGLSVDEKYLEKIDCTVVPCDDVKRPEFATTGYRVPNVVFAAVLAYNKDEYPAGKEPTSWADFYDTAKFPGKRAIWKPLAGGPGILESALIADGVPADKLYPLDVDRAFKKLDTIKDDIVWYTTGQQCADLLRDGEVAMGMCWNGRVYQAQQDGAPVETQWKAEPVLQANYFVVPKGTPNKENAMKLIAHILSPEVNASITKHIPYGPTNQKAQDLVDPATADQLPTKHLDNAVWTDDLWWEKNLGPLLERWQEWQSQ